MVPPIVKTAEAVNAGSDQLSASVAYHLKYNVCVEGAEIDENALYVALAHAIRERVVEEIQKSGARTKRIQAKKVHYLSMEFLIGKCTENNLINLKLYEEAKAAIKHYGYELSDILERENDPALGNGGLGRLAACFLDSMATLDIAGFGYGINYDYGLFRQSISNGYQKESPDTWKSDGSPWLLERSNKKKIIPIYGMVFENVNHQGEYNPSWMNWKTIVGVPHDLGITGYGDTRTNYLRLYSAHASDEFDIKIFNDGDYMNAVENKLESENISKILYPEDSTEAGKELRLIQEYFFVACAIRDIVEDHQAEHPDFSNFADQHAIQLNDTHPAMTIAELMRFFVDEQRLPWDTAWEITTKTCSYTNHTLLPEALECWSESLIQKVLPRHLQIIREIDRRFIEFANSENVSDVDIDTMKILTQNDSSETIVRMANLSIIGSHTTNGVAALHSDLVTTTLVPEFYALWPEKFQNKTNGITPRRWLNQSNPLLSSLITETIGDGWVSDLNRLTELKDYVDDASFCEKFAFTKDENKRTLSELIYDKCRIQISSDFLFDIQVKRIHEYKRQLLNALHIVDQYLSITEDRIYPESPVAYIFAGKAAPGYYIAKRIIKLINNIAMVVNQDPRAANYLKVAFIPDYRVSLAERIFPAANVSEQISTAGFEASGTGNMKFALNGALTVGTLDGANVEIQEEVGEENIYIFGKTVDEIKELTANDYNPWEIYNSNHRLKRVLDTINSDLFSPGEPGLFEPIYYSLLSGGDYFCVLADFDSYLQCQTRVRADYTDQTLWTKKAIHNVAGMPKFSSDRSIKEYADEIWHVPNRISSIS